MASSALPPPPSPAFVQDMPPPGGFPDLPKRSLDMAKGFVPPKRPQKGLSIIQGGLIFSGIICYGFYSWYHQLKRSRQHFVERDIEHRRLNLLATDYAHKRLIEKKHAEFRQKDYQPPAYEKYQRLDKWKWHDSDYP